MSKHILDGDSATRKSAPMARGLLHYFPDALAEVSRISMFGNEKHNPGQPLHWSFDKSADHADCVVRHIARAGLVDSDGVRESALAAWRALANLQTELMRDLGLPDPIGVRRDPPAEPEPVVVEPSPDKPLGGFSLGTAVDCMLYAPGRKPIKCKPYVEPIKLREKDESTRFFASSQFGWPIDIQLDDDSIKALQSFMDYMDKHAPKPAPPQPGVYEDPDYPGYAMIIGDDGEVFRGCAIHGYEWIDSPKNPGGIVSEIKFTQPHLTAHPAMAEALRAYDESELIRN